MERVGTPILSSGCPLPQPFPPLLGSRLSETKILLLFWLPLVMRTLSFGIVSRTRCLSYLLLRLEDELCPCWLTLTALFVGDFVMSFDPCIELGYFILGVYYKSTLVLVLLLLLSRFWIFFPLLVFILFCFVFQIENRRKKNL